MLRTKIYPNGEITFSWERKKAMAPLVEKTGLTEEQRITSADIENHGIVAALDFYRSQEKDGFPAGHGLVKSGLFTQGSKAAKKRGSKGITRYSRRIIECGAAIIEDAYDKSLCGFLTLTLPPSSAAWTVEEVNRAYNRFQQELLRELERKGMPPYLVGCVEAHPQRSKREGRLVPHYHLLFVGRKRYKSWAIETEWFTATWMRCLENAGCVSPGTSGKAATSIEGVKKSVTSYMGKYLSKAVSFSKEPQLETTEIEHPGSWHKISRKLLTKIKKEIKVRKGGQAERLLEILRDDNSGAVLFITSVYIDFDGVRSWIGEYARLKRTSIKCFLLLSLVPFLVG